MYKRLQNIKNEKMFKWWDLAVCVVVIASLIFAIVMFCMPKGEFAEVYVNGELRYKLPLDTNTTVTIDDNGHNVIAIENGEVYMKEADCPDRRCQEKRISKSGDQIVCLPNKVIIIITGDTDGGEVDATT